MITRAPNPRRVSFLHRKILSWYSRHGRELPWRNISNPYRILLSEVMLQQTQVSRVLVKYGEFLQRFPTLRKLAESKQSSVVIAWRGMGYNARAVRLHRLAKTILREYGGRFPRAHEEILALPGIGMYTANAVLSSAFRKHTPIVDVNVRRVLSRLFWPMKTTGTLKPEKAIWQLAYAVLPVGKSYHWNQALMDLGATICTARAPHCNECPVSRHCKSRDGMARDGGSLVRREPSKDGTPNRIYRGRIVETLRHHHRRGRLSPDAIGRTIHPNYSFRHRAWLEFLLSGLQRDGLIVSTKGKKWSDRRISLA